MTEIIKPQGDGFWRYVLDVWPNRSMLSYIALDVTASFYRNTIIGLPWLFLRPLAPAILFAFIFSGVEGLQTPGLPYMLFVLSGMVLLQPVNFGIRRVTRSLSAYSHLVKQRYFPRVIIPIAHSFPVVLQLLAGFVILIITAVVYVQLGVFDLDFEISARLLLLPLALALCLGFMLAFGCILTLLNAAANDVRMSLPMINMGLLMLTPTFYPITLIDESIRWAFLTFNPLVVGVSIFRYSIFGAPLHFDPVYIVISSGVCLLYFIFAVFIFLRADPVLADVT